MSNNKENKYVQVIVNCDTKDDKENLIKKFGHVKYKVPMINSYVVEVPEKYLKDLERIEGITKVEHDTRITAFMNIARKTVKGDIIQKEGYKGRGISIAVLDTGIFPHDDFLYPRNRIIKFVDYINGYNSPYDDNGHGTHVSGIIGGNAYKSNGKYMGMAPECNLIGLKVLNKDGTGNTSDVLAGLQWVMDNKEKYNIRIVNISMGSKDSQGEDAALVKAVNILWDNGVVVVVAGGNKGPRHFTITTPGISRKIITVGCSDDKESVEIDGDTISNYSSRGPTKDRIIKPDIIAPGANIISCDCQKDYRLDLNNRKKEIGYTTKSGSSMSAPIVSGAIAPLLQKYPSLKPNDVKLKMFLSSVDLGYEKNYQGQGLLDIEKLFVKV